MIPGGPDGTTRWDRIIVDSETTDEDTATATYDYEQHLRYNYNIPSPSEGERDRYYSNSYSYLDYNSESCEPPSLKQACGCSSFLLSFGLGMWGLLWAIANPSPIPEESPFIVGISRVIPTPQLSWAQESFSIQATSEDPGLNIYQIPPTSRHEQAACPPLNGPIGTFQKSESYILQADQYRYDFFHMNAGSVIVVDVTQVEGSTNFYLLQGETELYTLHMETYERTGHTSNIHWSTEKQDSDSNTTTSISFSHQVEQDDVYILFYENPDLYDQSQVNLRYHVELTTHDMTLYQPRCTAEQTHSPVHKGCYWPLHTKAQRDRLKYSCIVVQTVSTTNTYTTDTSETVQAHFTFKLRPGKLAIVAFFPLMIYLAWIALTYWLDWWRHRNILNCADRREDMDSVDFPDPTNDNDNDTEIFAGLVDDDTTKGSESAPLLGSSSGQAHPTYYHEIQRRL